MKALRGILIVYLTFLALSVRKRFRPYIVGVTGSSGKTTTKYFISKILRSSGKNCRVSSDNLNTKSGLPLAILLVDKAPRGFFDWLRTILVVSLRALFLSKYPDYLVLEYAADLPGDIKKISESFPPDIAVVTSIGVAHIEIFKNESAIIKEKVALLKAAREYAIVPQSVYERVKSEKINARLIIAEKVPFLRFDDIEYKANEISLKIIFASKAYPVSFQFAGEHNLSNLRLALLTSYFAGANSGVVDAVKCLRPLKGRGKRFVGRKEIMIIDESYNANPESMLVSLKVLGNIKYGRKVAVLGEMKEIGPISHKSHTEIARIAKVIADVTIGVGGGFKECKLDYWYPDVRELKRVIMDIIKKGDVVLFKGSRSNELEEAIEVVS
jgi:UDP-N-acetylmuramoyl-tripeptide--D-alanyl-D-alanine ligase